MRPAAATWLWCGFGSLAVCRRLCSTRDAPRPCHTGAHRARRKRTRPFFVCLFRCHPHAIRAMACVCFHGRSAASRPSLATRVLPRFFVAFFTGFFFNSDHRQRVLNAFLFLTRFFNAVFSFLDLESGLNQRDRATAGLGRDRSHGKPSKFPLPGLEYRGSLRLCPAENAQK